jgi:hypothetical protein
MYLLKPFALSGFEPGSSVPKADAMTAVPSRQDYNFFKVDLPMYIILSLISRVAPPRN